ncbi:hypothetical protein C8P63_11111 [Melghirimyces profundicolus]|uniref:Uncharacterized protein n=1 Tax=Melghirimyces profundicolus TaxID=1242148 RepID=A0A2T6BU23_9BACL|nr:hypothetical protein [Melghirimyces profundicolus]PTX59581.1 hypothetical protein C8P63_11111 [Melghirimyces profundicolus]
MQEIKHDIHSSRLLQRLILTMPADMHEKLKEIAEEKTQETGGAIKWSMAMLTRKALQEYIERYEKSKQE